MIKHWPLKRGFANLNTVIERSYKIPYFRKDTWESSFGKCLMITVQWCRIRFYIGYYYKLNKDKK